MNKIFLFILITFSLSISAQKYVTKSGMVKFSSDAPLEKIEATNNNVMSAIDLSKQNVVVKILVKSFRFEKALMEEHFNENYMESDEFPNSTFKGKFIDAPDMNSNDIQKIKIEGKIVMRSISKPLVIIVDVKIEGDAIKIDGKFDVKIDDFSIGIPSAVSGKISENLEVFFKFNLKAL